MFRAPRPNRAELSPDPRLPPRALHASERGIIKFARQRRRRPRGARAAMSGAHTRQQDDGRLTSQRAAKAWPEGRAEQDRSRGQPHPNVCAAASSAACPALRAGPTTSDSASRSAALNLRAIAMSSSARRTRILPVHLKSRRAPHWAMWVIRRTAELQRANGGCREEHSSSAVTGCGWTIPSLCLF